MVNANWMRASKTGSRFSIIALPLYDDIPQV
jgi:hypothetical protein